MADDTTVDLGPARQPRRLQSAHFLTKNQRLDEVSYWNLMQYLEGVSGEWPCTKMSLDMYIKFSLSYSIVTCKTSLSPLLARGMNEKTMPSSPKEKTSGNTCKWRPAEAGLDQLDVIRWPSSHEVRPGSFPRGGSSTFPSSSIRLIPYNLNQKEDASRRWAS